MSWVKRGAENIFLKKYGIIILAFGILFAILVMHQYYGLVNSDQYTNNVLKYHCDSNSDCAVCDGVCRSTIDAACSNLTYASSCECINGTCTNVLNK